MTTTTGPTRATSGTYTSTRFGLAAAAKIVEILRDLPLLDVGVDDLTSNFPNVNLTFATQDDATRAALRLGGLRLGGEVGDQYRDWTGFPTDVEDVYVVIEHDQPASSPEAARRERRRRIATAVRAVLGFAAIIAGGIPIGLASREAYGWLPVALLWLGLVLAPDEDYGIEYLVRRALDLVRRALDLVRRTIVRIHCGGTR